jgi:hypothetical protein
MTLPFDSCNLYFYLRNRAYSESVSDPAMASGRPGIVEFDRVRPEPTGLGLSHEQTLHAIDRLVDAELIHRLTPEQEQRLYPASAGHHEDALLVEPCDDLTAAIMIFGRS